MGCKCNVVIGAVLRPPHATKSLVTVAVLLSVLRGGTNFRNVKKNLLLYRIYPNCLSGPKKTRPCGFLLLESVVLLGPVFGRTDFYFWAAGFFRGFCRRIFLLIFVGKVPRKILHENPRQNPPKFAQQKSPTHFCRGAGPSFGLVHGQFLPSFVGRSPAKIWQ